MLEDILKTFIHLNYIEFREFISRKKKPVKVLEQIDFHKLKEDGVCVIENFLSKEECDAYVNEIDQLFITYENKLWRDSLDSDLRLFGAERVSECLHQFFDHPFLNELADAYCKADVLNLHTLAGRIRACPNNKGSGGGWHRDSVHFKQFKAIVYLTDVDINNGPYQYIKGSHKNSSIYKAIRNSGIRFNQNRLSEEVVKVFLQTEGVEMLTVTGKAGTLILTETRGIHRGMPIREGIRYALTNYYYSQTINLENIRKKFEPYYVTDL